MGLNRYEPFYNFCLRYAFMSQSDKFESIPPSHPLSSEGQQALSVFQKSIESLTCIRLREVVSKDGNLSFFLDKKETIDTFKLAAIYGNTNGYAGLGLYYEYSYAGKDSKKALQFYRLAGDQKSTDNKEGGSPKHNFAGYAQYFLGIHYFSQGETNKAAYYLRQSISSSLTPDSCFQPALQLLLQLYQNQSGQEVSYPSDPFSNYVTHVLQLTGAMASSVKEDEIFAIPKLDPLYSASDKGLEVEVKRGDVGKPKLYPERDKFVSELTQKIKFRKIDEPSTIPKDYLPDMSSEQGLKEDINVGKTENLKSHLQDTTPLSPLMQGHACLQNEDPELQKKAGKYYQISSGEGNFEGSFFLGLCYLHGLGGKEHDFQQGIPYIQLAAGKLDAADKVLACCQELNLGGIEDSKLAQQTRRKESDLEEDSKHIPTYDYSNSSSSSASSSSTAATTPPSSPVLNSSTAITNDTQTPSLEPSKEITIPSNIRILPTSPIPVKSEPIYKQYPKTFFFGLALDIFGTTALGISAAKLSPLTKDAESLKKIIEGLGAVGQALLKDASNNLNAGVVVGLTSNSVYFLVLAIIFVNCRIKVRRYKEMGIVGFSNSSYKKSPEQIQKEIEEEETEKFKRKDFYTPKTSHSKDGNNNPPGEGISEDKQRCEL